MLYEVSKSLPQAKVAWVSLDITKPHPDTSSGGWGAIQMLWCAQGVSGPSSSCVWNPRVFADTKTSELLPILR